MTEYSVYSGAYMVSIARSSLLYEWRRYLAAVLAVTFAGLLTVVQLALLLGLFNTVSVPLDQSTAELWIGFRNTASVDLGRAVSPSADTRAWMHPGVAYVERFVSAYGDLRRADGVPVSVIINGIDTSGEASAFSRLLTPKQRAMLREPDAVLIDMADANKLGAEGSTLVEINGKRARIAGTIKWLRAIGGVNMLASLATARRLAPETASQTTYYMVRLKPGFAAEQVQKEIADSGLVSRYSVWQAEDFSVQSQIYWLFESGSGVGTGFASLLALLVGVAITSQTLSAAITASIKEFAALRALGVSRRSLRCVVIEQAAWIGFIGLLLTAALTVAIALLGESANIAMAFPVWLLAGNALIMMAIAVGSGLLALKPLLSTEPVTLLR